MAQHSAAAILCSCSLFSEGSFFSSLPTGNGERKALEHHRWTKGHTSTLYSKSASWEPNTAVPTWGHFPALRRAVTVPFRGSRLARVSWHEKAEVTSAGALSLLRFGLLIRGPREAPRMSSQEPGEKPRLPQVTDSLAAKEDVASRERA